MAKIKCNEYDCKYNYGEKCIKSSIEVSKNANCDSFDIKDDGSPIDVEFGYEEEFFANFNDKEVICRCVSCKTNKDNYCTRTHLQVGDSKERAKCESYQKR
jgi:hypothetical protein